MTRHTVAVVGAGLGGVAVVDALARAGVEDVVVVDDRGAVGGRWLDRKDPGARSRGSVSEASLPHRPRTPAESAPFAPETLAYLQRVGAWAGVGRNLVHGRVTAAAQDTDGTWTLALADGQELQARFLVLATGLEGDPAIPEIRGLDTFEGPLLHTHVWQTGPELAGRRVAVIAGTGTGHLAALEHVHTAAALAEEGAHVTVFAQEQPWILPERPRTDAADLWRSNPRVDAAGEWLHEASRVVRGGLPGPARLPWAVAEQVHDSTPMPWQHAAHDSAALTQQWLGPEAAEHHHASTRLCGGTVRCEAWFREVTAGRLELLRTGIHRIGPDAVVDVQGTRHRTDAVVLATGAEPTVIGAGIEGLDPCTGGLLADWSPLVGTIGRIGNLMVTGGPLSDLPVGGDAAVHAARAGLIARLVTVALADDGRTIRATPEAVGRWERHLTRLQRRAGLLADPQAVMWPGLRRDLVRRLRGEPGDFVRC
ncbi:flavin-containing monooxygenase [Kytococcus sp. Marseille-QA3725]